jgi:filamentous hemagglutinin family protein
MSDRVRSHKLGLPLLAALLTAGPVHAQIVTDGSVGSKVSLRGGEIEIGADLGTRRGDNLFHSFETFGIATGQSATFTGPGAIKNVISRVTGGEVSNIDGKLASRVGQADFYFLNPAGVMFGPNATLDVPGSFHVSTAHELRFADGARFSALDKTGSGLTVAPPEAFGFLDQVSKPIQVDQTQLRLTPGKALSLVGGDLMIDGGSTGSAGAEDGVVQLVSAAAPGAVRIADAATLVGQSGAVRITQSQGRPTTTGALGTIDVSGPNGGGTIRIRGGRVVADGAWIVADNYGSRDSTGGLDLQASSLAVSNSAVTTDVLGSGRGGTARVKANHLVIRNGGYISSNTYADGSAGTVVVDADRLLISRAGAVTFTGISSAAAKQSTGSAGQVSVAAGELQISDGGQINASTGSTGAGGRIDVTVKNLSLTGGAKLFVGTVNAGPAGTINILAGDRVFITGQDTLSTTPRLDRSGIYATSGQFSDFDQLGDAGSITIRAGAIQVEDGGRIKADSLGGQRSGSIDVTARTVTLNTGGQISNSTQSVGTAKGGDMRITASESVVMSGFEAKDPQQFRSGLFNDALGEADAGTIFVNAPTIIIDNGRITADTTGQANAGSVEITADRLVLRNEGQIFSGTDGSGAGGNITVTTGRLEITGTGDAPTSAPGQGFQPETGLFTNVKANGSGPGGSINVSARDIDLFNKGAISVRSGGSGAAGSIILNVPGTLRLNESRIEGAVVDLGPSALPSGPETVGGTIAITVGNLVLEPGSTIETRSQRGSGHGGALRLDIQRDATLDRAAVTTAALQGSGGNIVVTGDGKFYLIGSTMTASVAGGTGSGGNIDINLPFLILNASQIKADAHGGPGGNITIQTGQLIRTPGSRIQASSAQSVPGAITITASNTDVVNSLVVLPETLFDVSSQLRETCATRGGRPTSSLIPSGRGGLPPDPGAPLAASSFGQPLEQQTATGTPTALTEKPRRAVNPITIAGIPQPVLGSPRLTCRG